MLLLQYASLTVDAQVKVDSLLTENRKDPMGMGARFPRFSWQLASSARDVVQTAYEIRVFEGRRNAWESGKVLSDSSVHVVYKGPALKSGTQYSWQVRVWDNSGKPSAWSRPSSFYTALFNTSDWKAKWIEPGYVEDSLLRPSPMFRKEFNTGKKIKNAVLFITSHGLYEAQINGGKVGDAYLTPGWTSYNKRLQYQQYDVTGLLKTGDNAIGVTLGSGWYRGYLAWNNTHNIYGKTLGLLCQLQIEYTDGSTETVVSDDSWKSSTGEIRYAEIYNGETIDARQSKGAWTKPGYDDKAWSGVKVADYGYDNLVATQNEPVTTHEIFKPVKIFTTPKGETVIDFGQNLVGWEVAKLQGDKGDTVTIDHAEVLDKAGNFYITNLRAARSENNYVLDGAGKETFHPHFTWHGFRYIRIKGYKGKINPDDFEAVVLYSDMAKTGAFSTSDSLVNQLQHNIEWGQRGNFLDVPTDCPQRDERLGWTGDAQVFSRTASFNFDVENFFTKWMKDVAADQFADGAVPHVIPNVLGQGAGGSTGWSDVSVIVPWNMYLAYGDKHILATQYPSMKAWVGYMTDKSHRYLWNTGGHFGDWLYYIDGGATDSYFIAQCFFAYSTQLLINTAKVLGKEEDVAKYTSLLKEIKQAFMNEYVTPNGRMISETQTAYVLALQFDMLPENLRKQAAARLVENIRRFHDHLTTGFLGTPYLCDVLTRFGYDDVAYRLLLQKTYPSWLYPVTKGATTVWERWDGIKPDGTFEDAGMNSFNHYAYGCIGDWMYRKMVGIDTYEDGVGYKHIRIQPHPQKSITHAQAALKTYYGTVATQWDIHGNDLSMDVTVPANTTATIYIPAKTAAAVTESGKPLGWETTADGDYIVLKVGSGLYHFHSVNALGK